MLLGKIFGKVTTKEFKFLVKYETKKFEYIQVYHPVYDYVLCQVVELEKEASSTTALCQVIGYLDKKDNRVKHLRIPFEPDSEVFLAEDKFIREIISLKETNTGAYIGKLDGKNINVSLDLKKLLTKHVAVLAKSGSGKSYTVGVLLEEIIEKKVPLLIIDPHGEYSSLNKPNNVKSEMDAMARFDVTPKGFKTQEYSDTKINKNTRPLKLSDNLSPQELVDLLPTKLSSTQLGVLYSAISNLGTCDLTEVLYQLQQEESNSKWNIISTIEQLKKLELFSASPTPYHEMIRSGVASIINLRGIDPIVQDIIVYKLTKDLFELRKQNKIPPFFLVVEEAHNFCPERSFGEKKSSRILRTVASEGRKFGLGLCVISQRPARVDKSVISQCTTQIIMKVTNPNDLKALSNAVEGLTKNTESEIQNLSIGTSLVTGLTDMPLFVRVRPRKSLHGGHSVDMLSYQETPKEEEPDMFSQLDEFSEQNLLAIIKPTMTIKDIKLMSDQKIKTINTILRPIYIVTCDDNGQSFKLMVDRVTGKIISDKEEAKQKSLPALDSLSSNDLRILQCAFSLKEFSSLDLVKHIGINIDANKELASLIQKTYILKLGNDRYTINEEFIFTRLNKFAIYDEPNFENISYNEKLEPIVSLDRIANEIGKFTTIKDNSECFLITHEVIFDDAN